MSSSGMSSIGRSEALIHHHGLPLPVELRRIRNARRLRLRLDERRRVLRLTCPPRVSARAALQWASEQREWVEGQLRSELPAEPFVPGAVIPLNGEDVRLVHDGGASRTPSLSRDSLVVGGPLEGFSRRIELFLRRHALEVLSGETARIAALAGLTVSRVAVGDPATRWGSCSSSRRIRYSWRLILLPPEVRRYVVAHEVAHLVHLDHGREFKALEQQLHGGPTIAAKALLRGLSPRLRRLGRTD